MAVVKYMLYIDFKANSDISTEWVEFDAKNILDAMAKADKVLNTRENVYLSRILEKSESYKSGGFTHTDYRAILCNRSNTGWFVNDEDHGEAGMLITRTTDKKGISWISAI
jgi:hypothetical protein